MGFSILPRNSLCSIMIFPQTALELNGVLNSSKKQALFHHHFWVPGRVPGFVSLLFWHSVPASFLVPGRVPGFVSLLFWHSVPSSVLVPGRVPGLSPYSFGIRFHHLFWFWLGFRGLSPYPFGILFHHPFLVPARVPPVPSSFPGR